MDLMCHHLESVLHENTTSETSQVKRWRDDRVPNTGIRSGIEQRKTDYLGRITLRPSPIHGTLRLPSDDHYDSAGIQFTRYLVKYTISIITTMLYKETHPLCVSSLPKITRTCSVIIMFLAPCRETLLTGHTQ